MSFVLRMPSTRQFGASVVAGSDGSGCSGPGGRSRRSPAGHRIARTTGREDEPAPRSTSKAAFYRQTTAGTYDGAVKEHVEEAARRRAGGGWRAGDDAAISQGRRP